MESYLQHMHILSLSEIRMESKPSAICFAISTHLRLHILLCFCLSIYLHHIIISILMCYCVHVTAGNLNAYIHVRKKWKMPMNTFLVCVYEHPWCDVSGWAMSISITLTHQHFLKFLHIILKHCKIHHQRCAVRWFDFSIILIILTSPECHNNKHIAGNAKIKQKSVYNSYESTILINIFECSPPWHAGPHSTWMEIGSHKIATIAETTIKPWRATCNMHFSFHKQKHQALWTHATAEFDSVACLFIANKLNTIKIKKNKKHRAQVCCVMCGFRKTVARTPNCIEQQTEYIIYIYLSECAVNRCCCYPQAATQTTHSQENNNNNIRSKRKKHSTRWRNRTFVCDFFCILYA